MAFLNRLGELARNIGDKASEAIETTKLNSKISSEKAAISECLSQIGEFYYRKYQENGICDPEIGDLTAAIDGHYAVIAATQAEIEEIRAASAAAAASPAPQPASAGGVICTSCGKENPAGTKFCAECGAKIEAPAAPEFRFCPECGVKVAYSSKFCGSCGAAIG